MELFAILVALGAVAYFATSGSASATKAPKFDRASAATIFRSLSASTTKPTSSPAAVQVMPASGSVNPLEWAAIWVASESLGGTRPILASSYWLTDPTRARFLRVVRAGESTNVTGYSVLLDSAAELDEMIASSPELRRAAGA
jgi:hypothetical protein